VKRGEVWTVSAGTDCAGKPRPCVIIQADGSNATASITVCLFTTTTAQADLFRPRIEPSPRNGLTQPSRVMVDKILTVPKRKLGIRIGVLDPNDLTSLDRALIVFLGLASGETQHQDR
jgi:mRNA interferase MazF